MLLIREKGLVKTIKFKDDKYVGDPLNAVRIFNEKRVDEIVVLDIDATVKLAPFSAMCYLRGHRIPTKPSEKIAPESA